MPRLRYLAASLMLVCFALSNTHAQQAAKPEFTPTIPAQYAATAFGEGGSAAGKTFGLTIRVEGLTTEAEIQELIGVLKQKGQDGLVSALEDMKDKGRVSPTASTGTGMRVVRIRPNKIGGQHILLATNRPFAFGELYNSTRSKDYPIGILTLDVDANGKGTGSFAPACKVKFNKKNELVIEHYGQKPFRLANVYLQK